ncbi:MAG: transglutaminase domain-containing protein [Myxococcaceae bacterium]
MWPLVAAMVVGAALLGTLRQLDYSTSTIFRTDDALVSAPPPASTMGGARWDFDAYRTAPSLQAFRDAFEPRCRTLAGVEAARCVTTLLLERSPHGAGDGEFVDANFDPAAAVTSHLAGAPGLCTARSAMAATALLAMGVPARVVQLLPTDGAGHNVLEVYDAQRGWVLFDPLFDSSYLVGGQYTSALGVSAAAGDVSWRRPHDGAPDPNAFAGATVQYPEPWLYTRVGEKCATWPFRGCYAQVGPTQFRYGPAQRLTFFGIIACGLFAALWTARLAWSRWRVATQ